MRLNINAYARLARFDKLAGAWLLLLPCWWGLALAGYHGIKYYILFAIGAVIMRAAGCTINDMADRKFDVLVERTKTRPLASGEISIGGALIFLSILLLIGLIILLQLPRISIIIGFFSVPLFITYPFMKRLTHWPQIVLGLTFNIGILIAYATVKNSLSTPAAMLYIAAIFWTLGYDTIYAHQDKLDDKKIGVKSTALRLGKKTRIFVAVFYCCFVTMAVTANYLENGFSWLSVPLSSLFSLHFIWQVKTLDINNPQKCLQLFKSNVYSGLIIFAALLATSA